MEKELDFAQQLHGLEVTLVGVVNKIEDKPQYQNDLAALKYGREELMFSMDVSSVDTALFYCALYRKRGSEPMTEAEVYCLGKQLSLDKEDLSKALERTEAKRKELVGTRNLYLRKSKISNSKFWWSAKKKERVQLAAKESEILALKADEELEKVDLKIANYKALIAQTDEKIAPLHNYLSKYGNIYSVVMGGFKIHIDGYTDNFWEATDAIRTQFENTFKDKLIENEALVDKIRAEQHKQSSKTSDKVQSYGRAL
jgi:hypothetical protein